MSESNLLRHGLESILSSLPTEAGNDTGVNVEIRAALGHINLRGDPTDPKFLATVARVLQQELPVTANTMSMGDQRVYWLGPDEWQIVTASEVAGALMKQLCEALTGLHASVSDLSGGQIALHVSGSKVRDVLAKGCTLDLSRAEFDVGDCAQSGLAKAAMLIGHIDDAGPSLEIVVRRSFSDYAVRWLKHAATEYGVKFSAST
jgi:sarcosine oxidase subunit gamma